MHFIGNLRKIKFRQEITCIYNYNDCSLKKTFHPVSVQNQMLSMDGRNTFLL